MKVICIDDKILDLTKGKWYTVIHDGLDNYLIKDNLDDRIWYRKSWFKTQRELREDKFKQLGL